MIQRERSLTVNIRPGMQAGERVVFEGECSETLDSDSPGDIVAQLQLQGEGFEWRGDNLLCTRTISYAESILGFELTVEDHPSGDKPVYRWEGQPIIGGTVLTIAGGGMPKKGGGFGDLKLRIEINPPQVTLSPSDREVIGRIFGMPTFQSASYQTLAKNE